MANHAIALRLGICSNIQFSYPARFLKDTFSLESKMGTWETGPLTWAVHAIQKEGGVDDLMRARAIADVFDRYILYRPHMVRRWSDGEDVDGSLQTSLTIISGNQNSAATRSTSRVIRCSCIRATHECFRR